MAVPRARWGRFLPTRWSWLHLLATPSSYLLLVALSATMAAKAHVMRGLDELDFWPGSWLAAVAPDVAVFLGAAAIFALAERAWRLARIATIPLALLLALLAIASAMQLWITGEQLTAQVMVLGLDRFGDVTAMARASIHASVTGVLAFVLLLATPVLARLVLWRAARDPDRETDSDRAKAAGCVTAFALFVGLIAPVPDELSSLYRNAVAHTLWGLASGDRSWNGGLGLFAGYEHDLVGRDDIASLRDKPHRNVVVVVFESTRRDATDLDPQHSHARTPHLVELAAHGLEVTHGRAVIPHTTKSLWSMLCGRLPILQPKLYETRPAGDVQCVPDVLSAAGWRTGFLQSAVGKFEDRPRLARGLGFQEFVAAEQFTTEVAGYLSTDDEPLVAQLATWLDKKPDAPFMVTMLTSSTHHPYLLTDSSAAIAREQHLPVSSDRDRYDRQVEAEDRMLGGVIELLRSRGVLDNTIIVVLGDHGEGFGEKAARQHALNYYEEGLRVPWVIAGPGVPNVRVDDNASLLDLAPTLLELLGVSMTPAAAAATPARSVLHLDKHRVLPFSCFFDKTCFGYVRDDLKVVRLRETDRSFYFDLSRDPDEHIPVPLTPELQRELETVAHTVDRHRTNSKPVMRDAMPDYPPWICRRNEPCGIKVR